ncbi:hypothetical protein [Desulfovibrio inopinatus]|uniref:hypothetical protein n=1 Tax=Desulfovibrio inopinatus TaxID=102109 RepID=UPI000420AE68|nr:hypothetical protein [Desulfovibrio inopinatus]
MKYDEHSINLSDFIDDVLTPSESFARLFANAYINTPAKTCINADFMDVAEVSGALASLTRHRLQQFACKLQEQIGLVQVMQPRSDNLVECEIRNVQVKKKELTEAWQEKETATNFG